ncbi:dihydrodipicolinate synthase family protein [Nocardioides gansuensis]|uniref:Dihydrodipicolinate synthase family protein n=1 Tax=Nocardioides gansuensis TaxID=2138300 RepID=A0A2T8F7Y3_9ACTN|nr:dihydrodipicolinate synthase family protein [Nocardioides gansuensis]
MVPLPIAGGGTEQYELGTPVTVDPSLTGSEPPKSRACFAAPHVVADPRSGGDTGIDAVDWERTLAFREHLWSHGLGVAEAMDTAQRGMGLTWPHAKQLISLSADAAQGRPIVAGAATDQLPETDRHSLNAIAAAYIEQCQYIEECGAVPVVMASRAMAATASSPADYVNVYGQVLAEVSGPVLLHWLGEAFDTQLSGYWGSTGHDGAADALLEVIALAPDKIDGVKISILDADRETALRSRMPAGVRVYTGDDYNYADLIRGDTHGASDALLGAFNPMARIAGAALRALDDDDVASYDSLLLPTVPLSRKIFAAPTQYYKTGIVFLAYVNGHQDHFRMIRGMETTRSVMHLAEIVRLADRAGVFDDIEEAARRIRSIMATYGVA